jgi:hypothetical protein
MDFFIISSKYNFLKDIAENCNLALKTITHSQDLSTSTVKSVIDFLLFVTWITTAVMVTKLLF